MQFFTQHVNTAFQHGLAFTIEGKTELAGDICFRSLIIIIRSHDLLADNI